VSKIDTSPTNLNLTVYGGDDMPIVINLVNAAGEAATLDGTLECTIATPYSIAPTQPVTVTATGTAGQYTLNFSSAITRVIAGLGVLLWDLQYHANDGKLRTLLKGTITSIVEITND
jgi:hypothetical protein